jgi:excisionase family DNA binding protein
MVMTVKEMAQSLGVSLPTAYALTERKGFPVVRIGSRKMIPVADLNLWLSKEAAGGKAV